MAEKVNRNPTQIKASTPLGHALVALERGEYEYDKLREADRSLTEYTDYDLLTLVRRIRETIPVAPPAAEMIVLEHHMAEGHSKGRKGHKHDTDEWGFEIDHDHDKLLFQLREEVKDMAAGKTKASGAKEKVAKIREKKEKVEKQCLCECGGATFGNFRPGHDARIYSLLRKQAKGDKVKFPKLLMDADGVYAAMKEKVH